MSVQDVQSGGEIAYADRSGTCGNISGEGECAADGIYLQRADFGIGTEIEGIMHGILCNGELEGILSGCAYGFDACLCGAAVDTHDI